MQLYTIFMPRVAAKLQKMGFKLIKTEVNRKKPQFFVYKFEDTPELHKALEQLLYEK